MMVPPPTESPSDYHLSVVIPTMNKVELLAQTLAALMGQEVGPADQWEIVVVNDGSTDGTADFLADLAAKQEQKPAPPVRVVSPGQNVGRARARNLGGRTANGKWLLFLDDDIVVPPGLLQAHLDLLRRDPSFGVIGYAVTDPQLIDGPHFHYLDTRGVAKLPAGAAPGRYFVTQNASVPRQAFLDIGGFDEGFSGYGFEDMEVAFRLEDSAGVQFQVLSQPVPRHVHHHTSEQYFQKKVECGQQSLRHIAQLHPGRIKEMRLHHVVDYHGQAGVGLTAQIIRALGQTSLARYLPRWLAGWPCGAGHWPFLAPLYFRLMNLAVLLSFRKGLADSKAS